MSISSANLLTRAFAVPGRSTRAIVDLDAIAENVRVLRRNQRPAQGLMAVVKAEGYGHGAVMTARVSLDAGAERFGVATVGEVVALRAAGLTAPILVLGPIDPSEVDAALEANSELTVGSRPLLDDIRVRAEATGRQAAIHLKVDTGMHRLGSSVGDAPSLVEAIMSCKALRLAGVCTHLASADDPSSPIDRDQLAVFSELVASVRTKLPHDCAIHTNNSAASIRRLFPGGTYDRVGIAMYGLRPSPDVGVLTGMRPALSLATRVARIHDLKPGDGVSYGHAYRASADERVALLPIGYADGYHRLLSNRAWVAIDGQRCPVRGRICMDQVIVGNVPTSAVPGSVAIIAGAASDAPSMDELAGWAETINYEIVSALSPRIPRIYLRGGDVVATLTEGRLSVV